MYLLRIKYMAMKKSKVTIMGAGVPGLSLAIILADNDVDVTLVDKNKLPVRSDIKPSARTVALMNGSLDVLKRANVWPEFKHESTRLATLSVIDDSHFPRGIDDMIREDFKASELDLEEFGYNIPLLPLTVALADKAKSHDNITIMDDVDIGQMHDVIVNADLVVGADGRHSTVRTWAGINASKKDYGQSAITCVISHSWSHDETSTEFHRIGGPCAFVPYGDNTSAVVWVEKTNDANAFLKLPRAAFVSALQERSRGILGKIDMVVDPVSWPLMTLKADRLIAPKIALVAEAAHVMSPIGAQGLNISLRDVDVLANTVLKGVKAERDIGSMDVLKTYERRRHRDVTSRHFGVNMLNQMVANDNVILREMRRFGLRAIKYAGPLRKFLMQEGLAPKS
jgi:2-octaprenyl-6-methoxyphenol hydroxylase